MVCVYGLFVAKLLTLEWPIFKIVAKKPNFSLVSIENGHFLRQLQLCAIKSQFGSRKVFQLQIAASKNFLSMQNYS